MYKKYHEYWYKKILAERELDNTLSKIDNILTELSKTSSQLKEDRTNSCNLSDKISNLIASKIDLEETSKYQKSLVNYRKKRLDQKLEQLKDSKDLNDQVYYLKFVSKFKAKEVARVINYSNPYTYELIAKIRNEIKQVEKTIYEEFKQAR